MKFSDIFFERWFWFSVGITFVYLTLVRWRLTFFKGIFDFILNILISLIISFIVVVLLVGIIYIIYFREELLISTR